jgi:hypothetical protein
MLRIVRVRSDAIEIDHTVKVAGSADPCIHALAVALVALIRLVILESHERQHGAADHFDSVGAGALDDFAIHDGELTHELLVLFI